MKVLFDYQAFLMQTRGGVSRYFRELAQHLACLPDVRAHRVAGFHANQHLAAWRAEFPVSVVGCVIPPALTRGVGHRLFSLVNRHWLRLETRRFAPDLYHPTYYKRLLPAYEGPRALTVFDMIHEIHPDPMSPRDPTAARKRDAVLCADAVLRISETTRRELTLRIPVPAARLSVTPLSGSLRAAPAPRPASAAPYFLFVGDRHGYKNFPLLVAPFASSVASRLPPAVLRRRPLHPRGASAPPRSGPRLDRLPGGRLRRAPGRALPRCAGSRLPVAA